jgi:hypothetical protein
VKGGGVQRLLVFLLFTGLVLAASLAARPAPPAGLAADLREVEKRMVEAARLHLPLTAPPPPGTAAFCRECHPEPAHPGAALGAAMLNQHEQRLDCLFCHWSDAAGPRPRPTWQGWGPAGKGSERRELLALFPPAAPPRAELQRVRALVTARRRCFERGPACADCHRAGAIGPWAPPGASASRTAALERLEDYFLLPPGQKWYFPHLR